MKISMQGVYWAFRSRSTKKGECRGGGEGKEGEIGNWEHGNLRKGISWPHREVKLRLIFGDVLSWGNFIFQ